jgi:uncharacterized protein (DUF427 family)
MCRFAGPRTLSSRDRLKPPAAHATYIPMTSRPALTPGPDHPITIERNPSRVQVRSANTVVADTIDALTLREASYPPVQYIPRADIDMAQLRRSDHATYCPYKGNAAYFDIVALGEQGKNAVWTYEQPHPAVSEIAGHLAFYPNIASVTELTDAVSE